MAKLPSHEEVRRDALGQARMHVVAGPVSSAESRPDNAFLALARGLAQVEPTIHNLLREERARQDESDKARAQADVLKAQELDFAAAKGLIRPGESPTYRRALMQLAGRRHATEKMREIRQEYLQSRGSFESVDDFNGFLQERSAGLLEGIDDTDYLGGMAPVLTMDLDNLKREHDKFAVDKIEDDARNEFYNDLRSNVERSIMADGSVDLAGLTEVLRNRFADGAETFFLAPDDINLMRVTAVEEVARARKNPALFDAFDMPDENGTPLAKHRRWGEKIREARKKVTDDLAKEARAMTEGQQLALYKEYEEFVKDGTFNWTHASEYVAKGGTAEDARSMIRKARETAAKGVTLNYAMDAVSQGRAWLLKDKDSEKAFDALVQTYAKDVIGKDTADSDVIDYIVDLGIKNGSVIHRPTKQLLEAAAAAGPDNPEAFKRGYEVWQRMRARNPQYALKHLDEKTRYIYTTMDLGMSSGLFSPEELLAKHTLISEKMDEVRAQFSWRERRDLENLARLDLDIDPEVDRAAMDQVMKIAQTLATFGSASNELVMERAVELFKANNREVSDGVWADTRVVPDDWDKARDWVETTWLPEVLRAQGRYLSTSDATDDYFIGPAAEVGQLAIYERSFGAHVASFSPQAVMVAYHKATDLNAEKLEAMRQSRISELSEEWAKMQWHSNEDPTFAQTPMPPDYLGGPEGRRQKFLELQQRRTEENAKLLELNTRRRRGEFDNDPNREFNKAYDAIAHP